MLFKEILDKNKDEVFAIVNKLFDKARKKQTHEGDILLVIVNGFYNEDVLKWNNIKSVTPYEIGVDQEGHAYLTQHNFFYFYLNQFTSNLTKEEYFNEYKLQANFWDSYHLSTQLELLVYLKFWEADFSLKRFYNLCRLANGEDYNWNVDIKSKKKFIYNETIDRLGNSVPEMKLFLQEIYRRQVRNAAAHSQFYLVENYINFLNQNEEDDHKLMYIKIEDWEVIFHKLILFNEAILNNISKISQEYRKIGFEKHYGIQIRTNAEDGREKYQFLKPHPGYDKWMPYESYKNYK
jgi:hypothetical protein